MPHTEGLLVEQEPGQRCLHARPFRHKSREGDAEPLCGIL